jgi:hypothetical protein
MAGLGESSREGPDGRVRGFLSPARLDAWPMGARPFREEGEQGVCLLLGQPGTARKVAHAVCIGQIDSFKKIP